MRDFSLLISLISESIQSGQMKRAYSEFVKLLKLRIRSQEKIEVAELARRLELNEISVKILSPLMNTQAKKLIQVTEKHKLVYGAALAKIGAHQEALRYFHSLDPKRYPKVLLYEGYLRMSLWQYQEALPLLENYVQMFDKESYDQLIGRVNLLAIRVHLNHSGLDEEFDFLHTYLDRMQYRKLLVNVCILGIEWSWKNCKWEKAKKFFELGKKEVMGTELLENLLLEKQHCLANLYRNPNGDINRKFLNQVRRQANHLSHWETLRDCDFHEAVLYKDRAKMLKVYFGTQLEKMRANLLKSFGLDHVPEHYSWKLPLKERGLGSYRKSKTVDWQKETELENQSGPLFQVFTSLCRDLYRPHSVASIHEWMYPSEHFHPESSINRFHQNLWRLRQFLRKKEIPISIVEVGSGYWLRATSPCSVLISNELFHRQTVPQWLLLLKSKFSINDEFDLNQASRILDVSSTTAWRLLNEGNSEGFVVKYKVGKGFKYRLVDAIRKAG